MKPTTKILENISKNSRKNKDEIFTRLYRYLLRSDLYYVAYQNLYANKGAATKGVDNDTADGFSQEKIEKIIQSLKDGSYSPKPVRRTYIKKKNNSSKKRPLGIPTFTDKLVQEVLRMILESIYEPIFSKHSHGFRPNRSCHTALSFLKKDFTGITWFIEGDITGCFDNIDHNVLIAVISRKIKDARIHQLIWKFLRAGYMEDWKYNTTYSGCPQGGIISPLLANIYLNELDKFAETTAEKFYRKREHARYAEYDRISYEIRKVKMQLETVTGEIKTKLLKQIKKLRKQLRKTPCSSQTDKVMKYMRYADDFLIGIKGTKSECEMIKQQFSDFIQNNLKMELSKEKTLITHSSNPARFLGYDIRVRRDNKVKQNGTHLQRTLNGKVELNIPFHDKIMPFLFEKSIIRQLKDGMREPIARKYLYGCTDLEILFAFNAELRGVCNYYALASNYTRLCYFAYFMEYSCLKTLAGKHKTTSRKILNKYKSDGKWSIPYKTKSETKYCKFADYMKCKKSVDFDEVIVDYAVLHATTRTSLEKRLSSQICELCGKTEVPLEMHHVNKVKNLKGKNFWEIMMIAKKRKTLAVCKDCHHKIHHP